MAGRRATTRRAGRAGPRGPKRLRSWSYSTWTRYDGCPRKVFFDKLDKSHGIKDELGPAAQRGTRIHDQAEAFVKGTAPTLAKPLARFRDEFDTLRTSPTAIAEGDFSFRRDWSPTRWDDWSGCWVRMKVDAQDVDGATALIIDYKTGQKRDYEKQLELYGLGAFKKYPAIEKVTAEIWYIDHGEIEGLEFTRDEEPELQATWEERVRPMMTDTEFRPKPGRECKYCPFSVKKGGPCEVGIA